MQGILLPSDTVFQAMVHASPLAAVALSRDGKVIMWNPAAQSIFGWGAEEVLGHPPPFVPEDKQEEFALLRLQGARGESQSALEVRRQRKDGTSVEVRLWTIPIRDATGEVGEVLGLLEDITERKRAEAALATRIRQLDATRVVSAEITRELDLSVLLGLIVRRAIDLVGADGASLYLWDESSQLLVPQVVQSIPDQLGALPLTLREGVSGAVADLGEGLIVNDYRASPHAHPRFLRETTITAVLAEPLRFHDRLVGVIAVNHQAGGRTFTGEDQALVRLFATQAAIAIENARLYQDADRQRREIELVADLSRRLSASLDLDTVLQRVVDGARDLTDCDLAQIALRDDTSDTLVFRYRAGAHSQRLDTHGIEPGKGIGGKVMVTGLPFRTADYAGDSRITKDYLRHTLAENVVAELAVPIRTETRVEGVLFVDNRTPRPFTDRDERTLQRLADHAAIAIRNAQLHTVTIRRTQQLDMLNKVALALTTEMDPGEVARRILESVQMFFPDAVTRLLEDVEGAETLRVVATLGLKSAEFQRASHLRPGEGVAGVVKATRRPVVFEDVARESRFVNREWVISEGFISGAVFPLLNGDRVIGILSVFLRRHHVFTDDEVTLLKAFASHAAIALENARLFKAAQVGRERLLEAAKQVVSAQEEERRHLARELHDETGQALTALRIHLSLMKGDLPDNAAFLRQRLDEAMTMTDTVTDRVRGMAQSLRPPVLDALGVNAALGVLCRDFGRRTRLAIEYSGEELPIPRGTIGIHLYRFLQEALTNIGKHARAHRVRVLLDAADGAVSLVVEDDGVGFDPEGWTSQPSGTGLGLMSMRERIEQLRGHLEITSRPGHGTRLVARVPWGATP